MSVAAISSFHEKTSLKRLDYNCIILQYEDNLQMKATLSFKGN